jgi:chromosome segregation ATPase
MARRVCAFLVGCAAVASGEYAAETNAINPIRKVVTLLQAMQKKVTEEGKVAQDLYDKYMCYCKTSGGDLSASISSGENKVPEVGSSIDTAEGRKKQLESDLKSHQTDRSAAQKAIAEATGIRQREKNSL